MNLGLISLILLLAAIVIGFVRNCNVGIICIGFSMILGIAYNISVKISWQDSLLPCLSRW